MVAGKISLLLQMCYLRCSEFHGEFKYVCKIFLTHDFPHPAPQTWVLGLDPSGSNFFLKKTQNDQCDKGMVLRYPEHPSLPSPPPPPSGGQDV